MAGVDLARTRTFEAHLTRHFDRVIVSASADATRFRALARTQDRPPRP